MENDVKNNGRTREGDLNVLGAYTDGNFVGERKDFKKMLLKAPQKSTAEKTEKKKEPKARGIKPKKWFPNAEGKFDCPYCSHSYKNPHVLSDHIYKYHNQIKETRTISEWLDVIPSEIIELIPPEKLKQLIVEKRKECENKKDVGKN